MTTPMIKQYQAIKAEHADSILMFRLGDFYEMFFDDAVKAAKILDITLTTRNKNDPTPIPLCGVPYHSVQPYLSKLLEHGEKIAICEQVEDPAQAKGIVKREVTRVLTPGVVLDCDHLSAKQYNFVAALVFKNKECGLAYADISTGIFHAGAFTDLNSCLEELSRIEPRELLLPVQAAEEISAFAKRLYPQLLITRLPANAWQDEKVKSLQGAELLARESALSLAAASAVWHYFELTQKGNIPHINEVQAIGAGERMFLDSSTKRNLELVSTMQTDERWGSLLWLLDQTQTAMGGRLLRSWLLSPLTKQTKIEERLQAVGVFKENIELTQKISAALKEVYDLERINSRAVMGTVSPRDFIALEKSFKFVPVLKGLLKNEQALLGSLAQNLDELTDVRKMIANCLVAEAPLNLKDGGIIQAGFSPELDELRQITHSGKDFIAQLEAKEKARTGISKLKVKFNKVFGYFIEISHLHKDKVPEHYIRKQTLVNAERYITPELKEYEEKVLGAEDKSKALEYELFCKLREDVASASQRIMQTARTLAHIDALISFAVVAIENDFVCPSFCAGNDLHIEAGRHPIVEKLSHERFVPNDVFLGGEQGTLLMITGPNMAGKSTVMRQTALIVLMAQLGSFVPAKTAKLGIVDRIFTRVGASDAIALGQSTFMVEMSEAAMILQQATARSLLLIDEIGRGTSTFDGLAIAWAVAEDLHDRVKAKTLFATHYHELTELAHSKSNIRNFHIAVKENAGKIIFLRKLLPGGTSHSYGIQVARLAGLPLSVIKRSQAVLAKLEAGDLSNNGAAVESAENPQSDQAQLGLFASKVNHEVIDSLAQLNPNEMTPLQALQVLHQLKTDLD